jgi:hypothetical protein
MTDADQAVREELDRLTSPVPPADWDAVLVRAGSPARGRRRGAAAALAMAAAVVLCVATPLGATIAGGVGGFSSWLSGEPGQPASKSEQAAFDRANARSWVGFPSGTKLRQLGLVIDPKTGKRVRLLGFRSGDTLCLRVIVTGVASAGTQGCAPLAALENGSAAVKVVLVDKAFGKGKKQAWYGLDHRTAPALQVTAGIAADGVRSISLHDLAGSHTVVVHANAFLYVVTAPEVGQHVDRITAKTARGSVAVPFAPALTGLNFGVGAIKQPTPTGPTTVERHVTGGQIGWLVGRRPVGQPLSVLPGIVRTLAERHAVFGRVVTPDPGQPVRVALTLSTSRHGGKATGLCTWQARASGGGGGGCAVRATLFARGPLTTGTVSFDGSSEYAQATGLATDDVRRITAFLIDGRTQPVPLHDNVYLVELARADFPVRLAAYDAGGRVIGLATLRGFFSVPGASPAEGRARLVQRVEGPNGAWAELYVGRSTTGGTCVYVKHHESNRVEGTQETCAPATGRKLVLNWNGDPPNLVVGAAPHASSVVFRFADGSRASVRPTDGYVIYAAPARALDAGHELVSAASFDSAGRQLSVESLGRKKR